MAVNGLTSGGASTSIRAVNDNPDERMTATANDLINSPDYLAYKFNFNTEQVEFLPVTRDEIRRANSLSRTVIDANRQLIPLPLADLVPLLDAAGPALPGSTPRFIFHTAFCSSTFLSRCLDVEGVSVGLREPQILLDAANAKRLQWKSRSTGMDYRQLPMLALLLLQKHAGPAEKLVIKPINSVNNIVSELLQITGQAKSLVLYTDAKNFLLSTLKKGEESKYAVRAMFDLIRCDFPHLANLALSHAIHMTDLKVIMTFWRLQIEQAEQALKNAARPDVMASLYGERLIEDPVGTLKAANRFLELGIPERQLEEIAGSDLRREDAKVSGKAFSVEARKQAYRKVEDYYGGELDHGLNWMVQNNPGTRLKPRLTGALDL